MSIPINNDNNGNSDYYDQDSRCLEVVTTCVGFDDILDVTLEKNHPHVDQYIVVTSHSDKKTQMVAKKHGATCVPTDLFHKHGRKFNKGAAINSGFNYFRYYGWRMHLDCDIVLPDNFKRVLFNYTHLDRDNIYGMDRFNVVGEKQINEFLDKPGTQYRHGFLVGENQHGTSLGHRFIHGLYEYTPIGYAQLWHSSQQKGYPYSLGTAAHDDVMFGELWPRANRTLLPSVICYHLVPGERIKMGENWEGQRGTPRLHRK